MDGQEHCPTTDGIHTVPLHPSFNISPINLVMMLEMWEIPVHVMSNQQQFLLQPHNSEAVTFRRHHQRRNISCACGNTDIADANFSKCVHGIEPTITVCNGADKVMQGGIEESPLTVSDPAESKFSGRSENSHDDDGAFVSLARRGGEGRLRNESAPHVVQRDGVLAVSVVEHPAVADFGDAQAGGAGDTLGDRREAEPGAGEGI